MKNTIPVITVDGTSGVGKGTLCISLVKKLGWHLLDSGSIYRAYALHAVDQSINLDDEEALLSILNKFHFEMKLNDDRVHYYLNQKEITGLLKEEKTGGFASQVAVHSKLREALLAYQRDFAISPGLVADGRDMGTVVFPDAKLKIFLIADAKVRAERRYKELLNSDKCIKIEEILSEIEARDFRDQNRKVSPLKPADDAYIIDTTNLSKDAVFKEVESYLQAKKII